MIDDEFSTCQPSATYNAHFRARALPLNRCFPLNVYAYNYLYDFFIACLIIDTSVDFVVFFIPLSCIKFITITM